MFCAKAFLCCATAQREGGAGLRWMPQPVHASKTYSDLALRPGDFSPAGVGSEDWAAASDEFIAPPVSACALWAASGGSGASAFVVPRSHLSSRGPREKGRGVISFFPFGRRRFGQRSNSQLPSGKVPVLLVYTGGLGPSRYNEVEHLWAEKPQ